MISLKHFFRTEHKASTYNSQPENTPESILDLFELDLREAPDNSFTECQLRLNSKKEIIQPFKKKLEHKEYGIFDIAEIKITDRQRKCATLKTYNPDSIKIKNLKKLIDDLFQIYGKDDSNKSEFTELDKREYFNRHISEFFGRTWLNPEKYKYPAMLTRTAEKLSITICGIELEHAHDMAVKKAACLPAVN